LGDMTYLSWWKCAWNSECWISFDDSITSFYL